MPVESRIPRDRWDRRDRRDRRVFLCLRPPDRRGSGRGRGFHPRLPAPRTRDAAAAAGGPEAAVDIPGPRVATTAVASATATIETWTRTSRNPWSKTRGDI